MARGWLEHNTLELIVSELPDTKILVKNILSLTPSFISMKFKPGSTIPIAAVCLLDVKGIIDEVKYAFHEAIANKIWYCEKLEDTNEVLGIFFARYYAEDAIIRLYSASEHLANSIIFMLEISEEELNKYKKKNISVQSAVGKYLIKEKIGHPITIAVQKLVKSKDWLNTMDYRNKWVHEQPPTIEGLGLIYKRYDRWQETIGGNYLGIGGSDEAEFTIEEIMKYVKGAMFDFVEVVNEVVNFYITLLEKVGITVNEDNPGLQIKF